MSRRVFIALNASVPMAEVFAPALKKIRISADKKDILIKWVPPENYHINLTFLGFRPDDQIEAVGQVLEEVCTQFAPFELKVEDVGAFASETEARVLWLGVQNKKCLGEFKEGLDHALADKNLSGRHEVRDFDPHITFGRLRNPKSAKDMISPFKRKSFGKIQITEVILYESKQQDFYSIYVPLKRVQLTGTPKED